ncbi:hypothetical protein MSI_06230 [Treponema sp. JC4]|uniref:hypothetical protein n=1 Tax=Treponema sp. JC4 TaxID=1124982 RepID=UPI00025B0DA9|nr:hypothetical protein [Treponema sp. JC4]EID85804.1 hypothetical protein MSI_06230 [Treponema sp. JC4]
MSVETTNKYLRANDAYNEMFDALEALNVEKELQMPLNAALVTISNILDYWKENNDVHTKPRASADAEDTNAASKTNSGKKDFGGFSLVE